MISTSLSKFSPVSDENSMSSDELRSLTSKLLYRLEQKVLDDVSNRSFSNFFRRIIERF